MVNRKSVADMTVVEGKMVVAGTGNALEKQFRRPVVAAGAVSSIWRSCRKEGSTWTINKCLR